MLAFFRFATLNSSEARTYIGVGSGVAYISWSQIETLIVHCIAVAAPRSQTMGSVCFKLRNENRLQIQADRK